MHCFLIGIILRFPVHQADRIVRGGKKYLWALGRSIRHDIERIFLIFEGGCFARTGFDKDNPVEMIWHDHPFIKPYVEVGG